MIIKGWKKRVDNRGSKDFRGIIMGWGRIDNDDKVEVIYSITNQDYITAIDKNDIYSGIGRFKTQEDALKQAIRYMKQHPNG